MILRAGIFSVVMATLAVAFSACGPKKAPTPKTDNVGTAAASTTAKVADANAPRAPAWKLKDLQGNEISSDQFKGKVVVLDFWATWCGPCRAEIPGYIALQKKYRDKGLEIVGVSMDAQGPGVVKTFVQKNAMNYTVVMGDEATTEAFGGIEAIPTTFLIDRDGRIRDRKVGAEETATYEEKIAKVLE